MTTYIPVIGLEIHAELLTRTKIFCSCPNSFGGSENSRVCPRCSGLPGTLPVLNRDAVMLAVKAGLATDCTIHPISAFDRKNYFYPDLPKAYQITQFESPICSDGFILLQNKKIRISRIHIEEDAGKLIHDQENNVSLVDYNRCGVPLIEIVTEPDFRTAEEVQEFVHQIALRLKYAGVCDARMEQGSLRVDVNISVMPSGATRLGTRTELKNLNSFKSIGRAIAYEQKRQSELLAQGKRVFQETRRFNEQDGTTSSLRSKGEAHDYRYFPEPDLPPILLSEEEIDTVRKQLPEMPQQRFLRYTQTYGLPSEDARLLIEEKAFSDFYDQATAEFAAYRPTANLMLGELNRLFNDTGTSIEHVLFSPTDLACIIRLSESGSISKNAAKTLLGLLFHQGGDPEQLALENGLIMQQDPSGLKALIDQILAENSPQVEDYKNGNLKILGFLMGQVIRQGGSSINPKLAKELLLQKLQ